MYQSPLSLLSPILKFLALLAILLPAKASAQVTYCYDSTLKNQSTVCPSVYEPLCGCDGITYRNYCEMYYHNGITDYRSGICEPLAVEFTPNPVFNSMHVTLTLKEPADAFMYIFDLYGRNWYFQQFRSIDKLIFDIETDKFPMGLYFIHAQTDNFSVIKRFIRIPER
jgi:hypothetical protein